MSAQSSNLLINISRKSIHFILYFFAGSIFITGFNELGRKNCKTGKPYYDVMKHDPNALPYAKTKVVNSAVGGQLAFVLSIFKYFLTHSGRYVSEGDLDINRFYRKTYNIYSDWFADTLIISWTSMREILFNMIQFIQPYFGINELFSNKNNQSISEMTKITSWDGLLQTLIELFIFTFVEKIFLLFAIVGVIFGVYNMYMGGLFGTPLNKTLSAFAWPLLLALLFFIGFGVFFLQFIHNLIIIPYTSFKNRNEKNGFLNVFEYALYKYAFYIILIIGYIIHEESAESKLMKRVSYAILLIGCLMFLFMNTTFLSVFNSKGVNTK